MLPGSRSLHPAPAFSSATHPPTLAPHLGARGDPARYVDGRVGLERGERGLGQAGGLLVVGWVQRLQLEGGREGGRIFSNNTNFFKRDGRAARGYYYIFIMLITISKQ